MTLLLLLACSRDVPKAGTDDPDTLGGAQLVATPDALDWGTLAESEAGVRSFTLENLGPGGADVTLTVEATAAWTVDSPAFSLEEGATREVVVSFPGALAGTWSGVVVAAPADPEAVGAAVALTARVEADADGDGFLSGNDCDDSDASVNPDAQDTPGDGVDQDCDGSDGSDADGDGWRTPDDCDDTDAAVNPDAVEIAGNGLDDDCDGSVDETTPAGDPSDGGSGSGGAGSGLGRLVVGDGEDDAMGSAVLLPDDMDGDGTGELVVATGWADYGSSRDFGAVTIHDRGTLARSTGWRDGWVYARGEVPDAELGGALLATGDVDGLGGAELVVGLPGMDQGVAEVLSPAGWSGRTTVGDLRVAAVRGDGSRARYGAAVGAGDLDGDGGVDLVAGATGAEAAYLHPWADGWWADDARWTATGREVRAARAGAFGSGVAVGDLDGDGYDEALLCGAEDDAAGVDAGACWVVPGAPVLPGGGDVDDLAVAVILGDAAGDGLGLGSSVAVRDADGDGRGELALGLPGSDRAGRDAGMVAVFAGGSLIASQSASDARWRWTGDGAFGTAVAFVDDVVGATPRAPRDGVAELLVGAPQAAGSGGWLEAGAVYLIPVGVSPRERDATVDGLTRWGGVTRTDHLGQAVASGDLDADGGVDLALGAPGSDIGARNAGAVYLVRLR